MNVISPVCGASLIFSTLFFCGRGRAVPPHRCGGAHFRRALKFRPVIMSESEDLAAEIRALRRDLRAVRGLLLLMLALAAVIAAAAAPFGLFMWFALAR